MTEPITRQGRPKVSAWQKQKAVESLTAMAVNGVAPSRSIWTRATGCKEAWLTRACGVSHWLEALGALGLTSKRCQSARRTFGGRKSSARPCLNDPSHAHPLEGCRYCEPCKSGWGEVGLIVCGRVANNRRG